MTGIQVTSASGGAPSATVPANGSVTLSATASHADGHTSALTSGVSWETSDAKKATVSQDGKVTWVSAGAVTITARWGGMSAEASLTCAEATE